jgi:hypothetical protein
MPTKPPIRTPFPTLNGRPRGDRGTKASSECRRNLSNRPFSPSIPS